MEIKQETKIKSFFKRYGVLTLACVIALTVALSIGLNIPKDTKEEPVSTIDTSFSLPMKNAVVVKDYSEEKLQFNGALNRWEIHLAIDMASEDENVFSVLSGVVKEVGFDSLNGAYIKIQHDDGFESVYSSLDKNIKVKEGDKIEKGQSLGKASSSAKNEKVEGGHLHFMLLKNGVEVDPNNYLDLQIK